MRILRCSFPNYYVMIAVRVPIAFSLLSLLSFYVPSLTLAFLSPSPAFPSLSIAVSCFPRFLWPSPAFPRFLSPIALLLFSSLYPAVPAVTSCLLFSLAFTLLSIPCSLLLSPAPHSLSPCFCLFVFVSGILLPDSPFQPYRLRILIAPTLHQLSLLVSSVSNNRIYAVIF